MAPQSFACWEDTVNQKKEEQKTWRTDLQLSHQRLQRMQELARGVM